MVIVFNDTRDLMALQTHTQIKPIYCLGPCLYTIHAFIFMKVWSWNEGSAFELKKKYVISMSMWMWMCVQYHLWTLSFLPLWTSFFIFLSNSHSHSFAWKNYLLQNLLRLQYSYEYIERRENKSTFLRSYFILQFIQRS